MKKRIIALFLITALCLPSGICFAEGEGEGGGDDGRIENYEETHEGEDIPVVIPENKDDEFSDIEDIEQGMGETSAELKLTKSQKTAVDLMKALNVISDEADLAKNVTRAMFAHAVYTVSGCALKSVTAANVFADISESSEYANEISALYDMGYVNGYMGLFRPGDGVSPTEAAVVAVKALGLRYAADKKGGYPGGYMTVAAQYGIFTGLDIKKESMSVLDTAVLLKNLLEAEIGDDMYSETGISGYYMTAVHDIKIVEGTVTDNGITSLDGSPSNAAQIKIGNETYEADAKKYRDFIGKKVKAYYSDKTGDGKYIYTMTEKDNQDIVRIYGEDIDKYENRAYTYYTESGRLKTADLKLEYNIIYNGRLVTDGTLLTADKLVPDEGYVELTDADNDGKYETVVIENYETFVVNEYNADENVLISQDVGCEKIYFDNADMDISMYLCQEEKTAPITYANIGHYGYALSVARSLDGRAVRIYLSADKLTGTANSVSRDDEKIVIDNKEYVLAKNTALPLEAGDTAEFWLNQYGHVIWWKRTADDSAKLAYAEKFYMDSDEEKVYIRLYTEDNIYVNAPLKDTVIIDSGRYQNDAEKLSALTNAEILYDVVRFKINNKNEVYWIDTREFNRDGEDPGNSLNVLYNNSSNPAFDKSTFAWGGEYQSYFPTSRDTKVFVASDPFKENSVYCYSLTDFISMYAGNSETKVGNSLTVYNYDRESVIGRAALVRRSILGTAAASGYSYQQLRTGAVVTNIEKGIDEDNEKVYRLTAERDALKETVTISEKAIKFGANGAYSSGTDNPYTISCGDIIRWGTDIDGKITEGNVLVLFDWDRQWTNSSSSAMVRWRYENRWHYLWLYDKEDDWLITVNQSVTPVEKYASGELSFDKLFCYVDYTLPLNSIKTTVYVYDTEKRELRESDMGELTTYKEAGVNCTKLIGQYRNGHRLLIVYK